MISKLFRRGIYGIAYGALFTFIMLTIMMFQKTQVPVDDIWLHMTASLIIGIFFGWASIIFDYDKWSPLLKTIIHFSVSIIFYFTIAFSLKWIPLTKKIITLSVIVFIVIYAVYWFSFYIYFKRVERSLNKDLQNPN